MTRIIEGNDRDRRAGLVSGALTWLLGGAHREPGNGIDVPTFSESNPEVGLNVVVQWPCVLLRVTNLGVLPPSGESRIEAANAFLGQFRANVGWPYYKLSTRLDSLHTFYV